MKAERLGKGMAHEASVGVQAGDGRSRGWVVTGVEDRVRRRKQRKGNPRGRKESQLPTGPCAPWATRK